MIFVILNAVKNPEALRSKSLTGTTQNLKLFNKDPSLHYHRQNPLALSSFPRRRES